MTPMMIQWQECKAEAKDALLFFRLGDFYEAFEQDAEIVAKELSLTLTARQNTPMCGVPFHAAEGYVDKLIAKGFKVAIAEQVENPKETKGLVKRAVTRIITPGTLIQSQLLSEKKNNFFVSISQQGSQFGLAVLDLSTAEFKIGHFEKEETLIDELCRLKPSELLVSHPFSFLKEISFHFSFIVNEKKPLEYKMARDVLLSHFHFTKLDSLGLKCTHASTIAAGSLLLYLKEELNLSLDHITHMENISLETMSIDRSSLKNLEIESTLLDLLDETCTPMGARLLRRWTLAPLICPSQIEERQKSVDAYTKQTDTSQKARSLLSQIKDLERLIMRISGSYGTPRDLYALGSSLSLIPPLQEVLSLPLPFDPTALAKTILSALKDTLPLRASEGSLFQDGYHPKLDELRLLCENSMHWMANYQLALREETGIKNLKVGYTKAFGYYIEVSRAQSDKIPPSFHKKQTLVNAERCTTQELKEFEHQALSAEERAKALELELFEALKKQVASYASQIHALSKVIAREDVLLCLAKVALSHQWTRPIVDESNEIEIHEGRHPVVEKAVGKAFFIANHTRLTSEEQLILITGPNMAGKSTYIRQVAIITILAQMGSFVPAKSARIGWVDKIFSRIGASDDLARGQSTFMVEMTETAHILHNATSRSLVLLDEIGRGTSTYDGVSLAWAVSEYLLTTPKKLAKTLFATHYWELTELAQLFPHAKNFQVAIEENSSGIVFLRKIIPGATDKSYGIHVAKLAGLPSRVIHRAEEKRKELEKKPDRQLSFLPPVKEETHPLFEELDFIDPLNMTPLQAHQKLIELKEKAAFSHVLRS